MFCDFYFLPLWPQQPLLLLLPLQLTPTLKQSGLQDHERLSHSSSQGTVPLPQSEPLTLVIKELIPDAPQRAIA